MFMIYPNAKKGYRTVRKRVSRFNVSISSDLIDEFNLFCSTHNYKRGHLVDEILSEFLIKWGLKDNI